MELNINYSLSRSVTAEFTKFILTDTVLSIFTRTIADDASQYSYFVNQKDVEYHGENALLRKVP